jgi:hypothetical protein
MKGVAKWGRDRQRKILRLNNCHKSFVNYKTAAHLHIQNDNRSQFLPQLMEIIPRVSRI